jgi:hypothetical protein
MSPASIERIDATAGPARRRESADRTTKDFGDSASSEIFSLIRLREILILCENDGPG